MQKFRQTILLKVKTDKRAFTLIEGVLAIALSAVVMIPLTMSFKVGLRTWQENHEESEILRHAHSAMERITSELKYAVRGINWDNSQDLLFYTRKLADNDWGEEKIRYWKNNQFIKRSVDDLPTLGNDLAGTITAASTVTKIWVTSFSITPYKVVSDVLVPLVIGTDPIDLAEAVGVSLTIEDEQGDNISLSSIVKLRNR